jgi:hypothetical protein
MSQTTTEQFSYENPDEVCISTSTRITFTFENQALVMLCEGETEDLAVSDVATAATTSVARSPTHSTISLSTTEEEEEYPTTFDDALDVSGLPDHIPTTAPTPTPASSPTITTTTLAAPVPTVPIVPMPTPASLPTIAATTLAVPVPLVGIVQVNTDNQWYVIRVGKEVGVYCGLYVTQSNSSV